ncbi:MAG: transketolase, partial [Thermomicrobiales bacterium]|nr:transketolase [Thermomicrobiales bacterium]
MSAPPLHDLEMEAINAIRVLSIDAIQAANSGHPGLPLGAAPMAYVLFAEFMKFNPQDPGWPDRDRFVLSAGHGSALLYSLLHLTGYALPIEELRNFRQLGSLTPGHPERLHTAGVEVTTGPLGQGFANGVGLAIAERFLAATFNRADLQIIDHFTYGIVSDGDIMEGVAAEAASLAGHLGLGKLIYLYDQNEITLAGTTGLSFSEDVPGRFRALGWHVLEIDGNDLAAVREAITAAQAETSKPSLICARTTIGYGSPKAGSFGVHGSPLGAEGVAQTKEALGYAAEPAFYVSPAVYDHFHEAGARGASAEATWQRSFKAYESAFPELAQEFQDAFAGKLPAGWNSDIPTWDPGSKPVSTRKASGEVINAFA